MATLLGAVVAATCGLAGVKLGFENDGILEFSTVVRRIGLGPVGWLFDGFSDFLYCVGSRAKWLIHKAGFESFALFSTGLARKPELLSSAVNIDLLEDGLVPNLEMASSTSGDIASKSSEGGNCVFGITVSLSAT